LIYLSYGLAVILGFIGVKLILHALHENNLPIINDGRPVTVVEISTELSLAVVVGSLLVTVLGSVFSAKGRARTIINNAQRHANQYLDLDFETDPAIRERNYLRLLTEKAQLGTIPAKYRSMIRDEPGLAELLARAQATHDAYIEANPQLAAHAAAVIEAHQATLP
jgi:tellurite resistance protein TerC